MSVHLCQEAVWSAPQKGLILSFDEWINLAVLGWVLPVMGSVFIRSFIHSQSLNRHTTRDKQMQRWKTERKKNMDGIHSGLDYALTRKPIPCPICPLATIRRSVTRPDWKWLFFQTLLKCVRVSPITLLLLIKLEPPLRSQWRVSPFSFPSFLFFHHRRRGIKRKHLVRSGVCRFSALELLLQITAAVWGSGLVQWPEFDGGRR